MKTVRLFVLILLLVAGFMPQRAAATPGDVDPLNVAVNGQIHAIAIQPDGKTIIAGNFNTVLGVARGKIARLNIDGTLDLGFDPKVTGFTEGVYCVAIQPDAKVLIGGDFTSLQPNGAASPTARVGIARLNADGSLDTVFDPKVGGSSWNIVRSIAVQPDGKVLLAGGFATVQPNGAAAATPRVGCARVNADGSLDESFDLKLAGTNATGIYTIAMQADGKMLLGGTFTSLQPNGAPTRTWRFCIARLNADGTLDEGFDPNPSGSVRSLAVQPDGKVLLGGDFTTLQPNGAASSTGRQSIARVNADGTLDMEFDPKASSSNFGYSLYVGGIAVQADGRVLLCGTFTAFQPNGAISPTPRMAVARVNADGSLDAAFRLTVTNVFSSSATYAMAVQSDGKVLLGGQFTSIRANGGASVARSSFARLDNDPASRALSVPDATRVTWSLAGAAPEPEQVTFDLSVDGGNTFTALGVATRVTDGWEKTGLSLPGSGEIRTRARLNGGQYNGSSSLSQTLAAFGGAAPIMVVEQPVGTGIPNGGSHSFGDVTVGDPSVSQEFTLKNIGTASLTEFTFTKDGPDAAMFTVVSGINPPIPNGGSTTFTVRFAPTSGGPKTATLHIASNNPDAAIFDLTLGATAVLSTNANLAALNVAGVALTPSFSPSTTNYSATVAYGSTGVTLTPTVAQGAATVVVNGTAVVAGTSTTVNLDVGMNLITVLVTAGDGESTTSYILSITRNPVAAGDVDAFDGVHGEVTAIAVQPDGQVILGGHGNLVQGGPDILARFRADDTLDAGFDPNPDGTVRCLAVQADGKVLLGGEFNSLQPNGAASPTTRQYIARLHADGTLDASFDPKANGIIHGIAMQADGKILLAGNFTTLQPNGAAVAIPRQYIARLHPNGTLDAAFDPNPNGAVYSMAVQADGRVLLGGIFTTLQPNGAASPTSRQRIARVNATGTLDTIFDPKANDRVQCILVQADGKVLLGGGFTSLQPNGAAKSDIRYAARVNASGTLDSGFRPDPNSPVYALALQANGKVLLAGDFTALQWPEVARSYFARVHADGTVDLAFDPSPNSYVHSLGLQADGRVLCGGHFTALRPNGATTSTPRTRFARLYNDAATQTLSSPTAAQVLWTRGGASPEASRVTFELSNDGGHTWNLLGSGVRQGTTPDWQLSGLALPPSGLLRGRGVVASGENAGSSGLVETVYSLNVNDADGDGLRDSWELTYWPTPGGHAAMDDFDHDGVPELLEQAFGLDPTMPDAINLPQAISEDGYLTVTISKHLGAAYQVQTAGTLEAGQPDSFSAATTTVLVDTPTTLKVRDDIAVGAGDARFLRVQVTSAP